MTFTHFAKQVAVKQFGAGFCTIKGDTTSLKVHREKIKEGLRFIKKVMNDKKSKYDFIILDEINLTVKLRLLKTEDLLDIIAKNPKYTHLIFTGRYAPKKVREACDLVSDIKEVKHPFQHGILAQEGVEF